MTSTDSDKGTQSIGRAVLLLRTIALQGKRGMRIDEIVQVADLSKTTCVRMLSRLQSEGLVAKDSRTKRYFLGQLSYELGLLAQPRYRLSEICDASIQRLATKTEDTVYLSERSGLDAVCTLCVLGDYPIKVVPLDCGIRRPLGVAVGGTAILSRMDASEALNIIEAIGPRYDRYDDLSQATIEQRVDLGRKLGFAIGPSFGAAAATSIAIGFPFANPIAAISVTALTCRMTQERQQQIVQWVQEEIKDINNKLTTVL